MPDQFSRAIDVAKSKGVHIHFSSLVNRDRASGIDPLRHQDVGSLNPAVRPRASHPNPPMPAKLHRFLLSREFHFQRLLCDAELPTIRIQK
jgi:hypothetical protein